MVKRGRKRGGVVVSSFRDVARREGRAAVSARLVDRRGETNKGREGGERKWPSILCSSPAHRGKKKGKL